MQSPQDRITGTQTPRANSGKLRANESEMAHLDVPMCLTGTKTNLRTH